MTTKKFTRNIEDFTCHHCGAKVRGDGYTNHCPVCLWSKHVDVNPGDRAADCGGLMRPVGLIHKAGEYSIVHQCKSCGHRKTNRTQAGDDMDAVVALSSAYYE